MTVIDEHNRKYLEYGGGSRLTRNDVQDALFDLFLSAGIPEHIRSDNDPEFIYGILRKWLAELGIDTEYIAPGSPWENSFDGRFHDELMEGEEFCTFQEAQVLTEEWRIHHNNDLPHSAHGKGCPALFASMRH